MALVIAAKAITDDGTHRSFDVIIYGTGFITNPFLDGIEVRGRSGRALAEHWNPGAHAYLGVATNHFPNLFFLYGPNTNLGHNSILLMIEAQVGYVVQAMQKAKASGKASVEVREGVEARYNERIQRRLSQMAWNRIDSSWYQSAGIITNNWPGSCSEYRRAMSRFNTSDFRFE